MAEQHVEGPVATGSGPVAVTIGRRPEPVHDVAVYAFEGMAPFELGVVVEVFGLARPELGGLLAAPWYGLKVCADRPGTALDAVGGFTLTARHGLDDLAAADTVVVPGVANAFSGEVSAGLVTALRTAHERGARIVSICSGAFALAAAGLLDGREATTHWRYADLLQQRHPDVRVTPDVLYVDNGDVLTSAAPPGSTSACTWSVGTTAPRSPTAWPAASWCRRTGTAGRPSSSRRRSARSRRRTTGSPAACGGRWTIWPPR
ncbi:DJ-1/PfpI family protein [Kitasatospora sp. NPDC087861]|uniref:DJ-1/PfpI family protein n=1 Tax=Kitasatospora sp. NPDC087861 TaxID=3364070 RepID=UPI0037F588B4